VSGVVVWLTGKPSSGKSTLAERMASILTERKTPVCVLDGDDVRAAIVPKPGYDPKTRDEFYATLANLAALLARQGLVVLVPATAYLRGFRERARRVAPAFVEVYVHATREEVEQRDSKGLYAAVHAGRISGVPGADIVFEEPKDPDVRAEGGLDEAATKELLSVIEKRT
jgi:adenylylsulfate kinase